MRLVFLGLTTLFLAPASGWAADSVERTLPGVMGTVLKMEIEASSRERALRISEEVLGSILHAEKQLSTWRTNSELSSLNRAAPGIWVEMSPEVVGELQRAADCARETAGAFDPGIGSLLAAWDARGQGRIPTPAERSSAAQAGGIADLEIRDRRVRRRSAELLVEEGGFGKGAALDRVTAVLQEAGEEVQGSIDLGGQLLVFGGSPRAIGVAHPNRRDEILLTVEVRDGSVATSGNSERGIEIDGVTYSHILDPRNGQPVHDFGSLTAVTKDGLRADCLATGLYVLGPEDALAWAATRQGVEILVLETLGRPRDGRIRARATTGLIPALELVSEDLSLEPYVTTESSPSTGNISFTTGNADLENRGWRSTNSSSLKRQSGDPSMPRLRE